MSVKAAHDEILYRAEHASPVGVLTLVASETHLVGVYFENHKVGGPPAHAKLGASAAIAAARLQLDSYFDGGRREFDLPIAPRGTLFQRQVWSALERIPFGRTRTYGDIANALGAPKAARAIGAAVGRNPISIVVPCHRVIGASGALTGFAGGIERKQALLDLEQAPSLRRAG